MIGCHLGRCFQVTVAGGSYQDGLTAVLEGVPPGMLLTEREIYGDLLLRKPGADELSSPRKEPDLPVIYTGLNAADTIEGAGNWNHTNGTPLSILIPNLDRHFVHIKQYQDTNRTPRPGHASYASFMKYGPDDDAIGAGIFSGRYTSTIVAAGFVAKKILKLCGIDVFSYVREIAGVRCDSPDPWTALQYTDAYKKMRCDYDPFYQEVYVNGRITPEMRFLEKPSILAEIEKEIGRLGRAARDGELSMADMQGGTFTISNGGVFGSLMSTPILNPPQSGILGMHKIQERPIVVDGQMEIRPMMYLALSYDHRLIDGREAVTFLVRIKESIEEPERLLLDL